MINLPRSKGAGKKELSEGGYSLMELLVVMAIIVVTLTFFLMGIRLIFTSPSRQCTRELKAAIEKTRIDTMGRNAAGLRVYQTDKGVFVQRIELDEKGNPQALPEERIGNNRVKVRHSEGAALKDLDAGGVFLAFKRETGGFYGGVSDGEDDYVKIGSYTSVFVEEFEIKSGGATHNLTLRRLTGAVEGY